MTHKHDSKVEKKDTSPCTKHGEPKSSTCCSGGACGSDCTCDSDSGCKTDSGCDCTCNSDSGIEIIDTPAIDTPIDAIQKELSDAMAKQREYLETMQHVQAEFENFRKRVDRDKENFCKFASLDLIKKLLPLVDTITLIDKNASTESPEELKKAVSMLHQQMGSFLKGEGVEKIPSTGIFNPSHHEPLFAEESDKPVGTILNELQPGYLQKGQVLRAARVILAKAKVKK